MDGLTRADCQIAELAPTVALTKKRNDPQVARSPEKVCGRVDLATQFRGEILTRHLTVFGQVAGVILNLIPILCCSDPLNHRYPTEGQRGFRRGSIRPGSRARGNLCVDPRRAGR